MTNLSIYDFTDYKKFVHQTFATRPKRGRGEYRRLSQALRLSSVAVSQVFRGDRDLSSEQALATAGFLGLDAAESEYFLLMVQLARAGSRELRAHYGAKLKSLAHAHADLSKRVKAGPTLSDEARAVFYSNWQYSAVRIASSLPGVHTVDALADRLQLPRAEVSEVVRFLLEQGLCVSEGGKITMGPTSTMLGADSPFINNHRRNWRLKGLEHLAKDESANLFYSGVVSLSAADRAAFRKELVDLIARFVERVKESPSETLACLNIDWFELLR